MDKDQRYETLIYVYEMLGENSNNLNAKRTNFYNNIITQECYIFKLLLYEILYNISKSIIFLSIINDISNKKKINN